MKNISEPKSCRKGLHDLYRQLTGARWIRFGIVGGLATFSYFLLGLLFVDLVHLPLLVGNTLAYVISFFVSYAGQRLWTFEAKGSHAATLPKFALAQAFGLALNSCIIAGLVYLGTSYLLAMIAATAAVPVFVYLICKYWVFKKQEENA